MTLSSSKKASCSVAVNTSLTLWSLQAALTRRVATAAFPIKTLSSIWPICIKTIQIDSTNELVCLRIPLKKTQLNPLTTVCSLYSTLSSTSSNTSPTIKQLVLLTLTLLNSHVNGNGEYELKNSNLKTAKPMNRIDQLTSFHPLI